MRITKEAVIQGAARRVQIEAGEIQEGGQLTIRPLTELEAAEYNSVCVEGLSVAVLRAIPKLQTADSIDALIDAGLTMDDIKAMQMCEKRAHAYIVAKALSCDGETWTDEDAWALPPAVRARIAATAMDISGMSKESAAMARRFRDETGGGEPDSDAPVGLPDGADNGRVDAAPDDGPAGD